MNSIKNLTGKRYQPKRTPIDSPAQELVSKLSPRTQAILEMELDIHFPGQKITYLSLLALLGQDIFEYLVSGVPPPGVTIPGHLQIENKKKLP